jgi:hypothetical protein
MTLDLLPVRKLGRKAVKTDSRTLKRARYLTPLLPPAPPSRDWTGGVTSFGEMLNDTLGDCIIAAPGHAIQVWSLNAKSIETTVTDNDILLAYEAWCGYNPSDPSTDQGGVILDVLTDWRKSNLAGHVLSAFASINIANIDEIRQAIDLFGGITIGLGLPNTAQNQTSWSVIKNGGYDATRNSWGGHCVFVTGYDQGGFECITWGQTMWFTLNFWKCYADEAYALLSPDWFNNKITPSGFNLQQMTSDLAGIR